MNSGKFEDGSDHRSGHGRTATIEASLQKISSAMDLLDQAGEHIAVAHLQAGFDVLLSTAQIPASDSSDAIGLTADI